LLEAAINAAIARARVAVLLLSSDFLASDFITGKELPAIFQARAKDGLKIVWILVSACVYEQHGFDKIQAAHGDLKQPLDTLTEPIQNVALADIVRRHILELVPSDSR
jgi:hypothetical protein